MLGRHARPELTLPSCGCSCLRTDAVFCAAGGFKSADHQNDARVQEVAEFAVAQVILLLAVLVSSHTATRLGHAVDRKGVRQNARPGQDQLCTEASCGWAELRVGCRDCGWWRQRNL